MPSLDIADIRSLHQAGQLEEAELGYVALLKNDPKEVEALHGLGILFVQKNEHDKAQVCFQQALNLDQSNPVLSLHLANVLKLRGLLAEAEATLLAAAELHPKFAAIDNNLGVLYFAQEKWELAVDLCRSAISKQSNYVDAYYNYGLALSKLKRNEEAICAYQALIEISPEHVGANFQLGCLLQLKRQPKEALKHFMLIYKNHPFHVETIMNLAACCLQLNLVKEAKDYYQMALDIVPDDIQALFNLGVLAGQVGEINKAIDYYLHVLKIDFNHYPAQYNLAVSYLTLKQRELALKHFQEARRLQPENETIQHLVQALTSATDVATSPPNYVRALFDGYAKHYDQHMMQALAYQVPGYFGQLIDYIAKQDPGRWEVLDLGCGTGLCGELVRPHASYLAGVDLSQKMLAVAKEKGLYDELICEEVVSFLRANNKTYHMVLAGDTLVYLGDLNEVFIETARALQPGGWFLFNIEIGESSDYCLASSGRFVHSKTYIEKLAEVNDFTIVKSQAVVLREQEHMPVLGYLFLMRK